MLRVLGCIALGLVVLITAGPFLVPVPPLEDAVPPWELAVPQSRFSQVNDIVVHYISEGRGEPTFMMLHGFGGSVFSWRELMQPLGQQGTAVAFDRPPFGLSERPLYWHGPNPYTTESQVRLTVELMDALGIDKAVLLGHSAGGSVALRLAQEHPDLVHALVLVSPGVGPAASLPPLARHVLGTPQVRRLAPLFLRGVRDDFADMLRQAWHDPDRVTHEIITGYERPFAAENWDRALWELFLAAGPTGVEDRLHEVELPVLVITGEDDRIIAPALSAALAAELPQSELLVIPDCGHVAHEEHPYLVLAAVEEFLCRHGLNECSGTPPAP